MNAFQLGKIISAVAPVAAKVSREMSANARICPEMSGQNHEIGKTKPNGEIADDPQGHSLKSKSLSPRQLTAARLMLRGKTAAGVGQLLGISERTVRRWTQDSRFIAEINALSTPRPVKPKPAFNPFALDGCK